MQMLHLYYCWPYHYQHCIYTITLTNSASILLLALPLPTLHRSPTIVSTTLEIEKNPKLLNKHLVWCICCWSSYYYYSLHWPSKASVLLLTLQCAKCTTTSFCANPLKPLHYANCTAANFSLCSLVSRAASQSNSQSSNPLHELTRPILLLLIWPPIARYWSMWWSPQRTLTICNSFDLQ